MYKTHCATCFMLHNKGNIMPYYGEDFSGYATSFAHEIYFNTMTSHSIFLIFKIDNTKQIPENLLLFYYF